MKYLKSLAAILLAGLFLLLAGCFTFENNYSVVPPGRWRAVLELSPSNIPVQVGQRNKDNVVKSIDEVTEGQLPFNFDIIYTDATAFYIEIINGPERIKVDDIKTWHDRATNEDSILINFPVYGTYIKAGFEDDKIEGKWFVPYRGENYSIPFYARYGKGYRFTQLQKEPIADLTGKWEVTFSPEDDPYKAVGEFQQDGNELMGTFRTETGDYRYLAGTMQEDKAYLSCFDGSHAFLFEAKLDEDDRLFGSFRSGSHYRTIWNGRRNSEYELGSPDDLTYLKEGYDQISFELPNINGDTITLEDEQYQNKVKIVQIMGTWCPNCRDETTFLVDYLQKNPNEDLAVIGIGFERYRDQQKNMKALRTYKNNFGMNYELLLGGYFDKKEAAETFPMLNHILSYPTMIFIDRDNQVRRIHTGFSGPATSTYDDFVADFDRFVQSLLDEKNELN
jgi:thiol-disulfide isomerase/thioredoxin